MANIGLAGYAVSQFIFASTSTVSLIPLVCFAAGGFGNALLTSLLAFVTETSESDRTEKLSVFAGVVAGGGTDA